jgi:hypothetical protein
MIYDISTALIFRKENGTNSSLYLSLKRTGSKLVHSGGNITFELTINDSCDYQG